MTIKITKVKLMSKGMSSRKHLTNGFIIIIIEYGE